MDYMILKKMQPQYVYQKTQNRKPRTGIEPATTRLQVSRSTRLSYRGMMKLR